MNKLLGMRGPLCTCETLILRREKVCSDVFMIMP